MQSVFVTKNIMWDSVWPGNTAKSTPYSKSTLLLSSTSGGSRGGSLGSNKPPFLAGYSVLSMGSSVRSNFKEPPWALASYSNDRFCLLLTYRNGFKWIVVDLQPSRTREDLKQVQTRHFNEEWAWSTNEVREARKFCHARTPLSQILDPPLSTVHFRVLHY